MKKKTRAFLVIRVMASFWAFYSCAMAWAETPLKVCVSVVPQKYFVEKVGGDLVDISVMVLPGANPHIYEPKPHQMIELTKTCIYFAIDVTFEKVWLTKFVDLNPDMLVVHTESGIDKIPMSVPYDMEEGQRLYGHKKGEEKTPHHGIEDPHIWLSPALVMLQARHIFNGLLKMDPSHKKAYFDNYKKFITELLELDLQIKEVLTGESAGAQFMVYHPAWGYFAEAYGLRQIPVAIEGKEPTPGDLKRIIEHAREKEIKMIFAQPQFPIKMAVTLAQAIDGQVVIVDPMAYDWAANLRNVALKFKEALR